MSWRPNGFLQFEIIKNVLVSSFRFIWISMLWVYEHYKYVYSFRAVIDLRCQNLTSADVRLWRLKLIPALNGLIVLTHITPFCKSKLKGITTHLSSNQLLPFYFVFKAKTAATAFWICKALVAVKCHCRRLLLAFGRAVFETGWARWADKSPECRRLERPAPSSSSRLRAVIFSQSQLIPMNPAPSAQYNTQQCVAPGWANWVQRLAVE